MWMAGGTGGRTGGGCGGEFEEQREAAKEGVEIFLKMGNRRVEGLFSMCCWNKI